MELPDALLSPGSKNFKNPPRKSFLYFRKWNFLARRLKKVLYFKKWNSLTSYFSYILKRNFPNSKKKNKKPTLKGFLIFWEMELSSPNIKKVFLYLSKELAKLKTKNFCLRENFSHISTHTHTHTQKVSYIFSYKEAKFSKLKYFLIIVIKRFFSFYITFFYTQPVYFFNLKDLCNIHNHIVAFFLFIL